MTFTVWGQTGGGTLVSDSAFYTLGNQFATAQQVVLTGIWFYSPAGAASLPSQCVIFNRSGTQVAGTLNTSPSWSGAAGSGWVKCSYNGTVTLPWGSYVVAVLGGGSNWYSSSAGYWASPSGTGQAGESNNPLSMEPARFTDNSNQSVVNAGSALTFPTGGGQTGNNNWIDVEVALDAGVPRYTALTAALPPDPSGADLNTAATVGMQFSVSKPCIAAAVWQLSAASDALPVHVGIFQITGVGTGTLVVDNSSPVWSGPGIYAWNRCPLTPALLTPGVNYMVATFEGGTKPWCPVGGGYWTTGNGSLGKTNGPLIVPNNAGSVNGQGAISSATGSFTFPNTSGAGEAYFIDIEVMTAPTSVYSLFGQQAVADGVQNDTASYTIGDQFSVSVPVQLTGIWWYSASAAGALPSQCVIYDLGASSQVPGTLNTSPSWSGAAGSGWVKCSYNGAVTLQPGKNYEVCVLGPASAANWYTFHQNWWTTGGPGASGITNGPLTAPNNATALHGQSSFSAGSSLQIPTSNFNSANFWMDVEVKLPSGPLIGTLP